MNTGIMLDMMSRLRAHRARERWSRQELLAHQERDLRTLREYAYARSPFYQRFHRGLSDAPLRELPVLTKATLMENFDDLVTDRSVRHADVEAHARTIRDDEQFLGRYWVTATSGSTGRPGLFLFNRDEWTAVLTSFARAHEWAGLKIRLTHRMKMASVASTGPTHMSARAGATLRSWWMPALRLAASDPLESVVRRLNARQPEMLVSYASMARILAEEQLAGRLHIHPHLVFTSSEVLTDETRRRVAQAWGHQPFNEYAATETGGLASECAEHRGLHLFEDLVITEVVDEHNRPVPPGTYGAKVLVSTLFSRTQPLIRYEVSDSVRLAAHPCPCGRPHALIDGIQGRAEDVLHLPSADGRPIPVHPVVFHRVMDTLPAAGWQVVQEDSGLTILLSGVRGPRDDRSVAIAVEQALAGLGASVPRVRVQRVSAIPQTSAGKTPLIRAAVSHASPPGPTVVAST